MDIGGERLPLTQRLRNPQQNYQQRNYNGQTQKGYNQSSGTGKILPQEQQQPQRKRRDRRRATFTTMTSTATSAAKRAITHRAAGTTPTQFTLSMVSINSMIFDNKINLLPMFLLDVFRFTAFNDNNHNSRSSMSQHQVPSSKTSALSVQSSMATTKLILTFLSSTWSTESSSRRSFQHSNSIGRYSARLAPCHLWRPSPSFRSPTASSRLQGPTVNRDDIKMYGYKEIDVIIGNISMYVRLYTCDVLSSQSWSQRPGQQQCRTQLAQL